MLDVWILNVGQGDSIVLHYRSESGDAFAIIDSNHHGGGSPRALTKLQEFGATDLSFVALTHPHADHYSGLYSIFEHFRNNIAEFYCYPFGLGVLNRLEKLAAAYRESIANTDSPTIHRQSLEFIKIIKFAKDHFLSRDSWFELSGMYSVIMPPGFSGVEIVSILPPPKVKGPYIEVLENPDRCAEIVGGRLKENDLSLAFLLRYHGIEIILGGDGSSKNWIDQRRAWERASIHSRALAAKLPHHGSKKDCTNLVINHLFSSEGRRFGVISANGRKHPDSETLKRLSEQGVEPLCTNLAASCGARFRDYFSDENIAPSLLRQLNIVLEPGPMDVHACQGDIRITIDDSGELSINTETGFPCVYSHSMKTLFPS